MKKMFLLGLFVLVSCYRPLTVRSLSQNPTSHSTGTATGTLESSADRYINALFADTLTPKSATSPRIPNANELTQFESLLSGTGGRAATVSALLQMQEFANVRAETIFYNLLGRDPQTGDVSIGDFQANGYQNFEEEVALLSIYIKSAEQKFALPDFSGQSSAPSTSLEFCQALYIQILGRVSSYDCFQDSYCLAFAEKIVSDTDQTDMKMVASLIVGSPEARGEVVTYLYQTFLRASADLKHDSVAINRVSLIGPPGPQDFQALFSDILTSDEYWNYAQAHF